MLDTAATFASQPKLWLKRMGRIHCLLYLALGSVLGSGLLLTFIVLFDLKSTAYTITAMVICLLLPYLVLFICRVRDLDFPSWTAILAFVPVFGTLFSIAILAMPGTLGQNRYGNPPRAPQRWMTVIALILAGLFALYMLCAILTGAIDGYNAIGP